LESDKPEVTADGGVGAADAEPEPFTMEIVKEEGEPLAQAIEEEDHPITEEGNGPTVDQLEEAVPLLAEEGAFL